MYDEATTYRLSTSGVCQCGGCRRYFTSVYAFDKHRAGPADARRCLTKEEMLAAGMAVNERGLWVSSAMPEGVVVTTRASDHTLGGPTTAGEGPQGSAGQ